MKPRHITFCLYYLRNFNGAEAARKSGYSQKRAKLVACELLKRPDTKRYLKTKLNAIWQDEADVVRARVFNLWSQIAFEDVEPKEGQEAPSIQDMIAREAMRLKASELLAKYLPAGQLGEPEQEEDGEFKIIKIKAIKPNEGSRVLPAPEAD